MIAHILGLTSASGTWYLWWSGIGSDIAELSVLAAIGGMIWKRLNCHEANCKRIATHHVDGTPFWTCKQHHPHIDETNPITAAHIAHASERAKYRIHL